MRSSFCRMFVAVAMVLLFTGLLAQRAAAQPTPPVKIHLEHWQNGSSPKGDQKWVNGNLNKTNSRYSEGHSVPTRFVLENLEAGQEFTLRFRYLTSKNQSYVKHAHDYLTAHDASLAGNSGTPDPCLPVVQGNGTSNICVGGTVFGTPLTDFVPIPADPNVSAGLGFNGSLVIPREFRLWNANFTSAEAAFEGVASGTAYTTTTLTQYSVTFTVTGAVGSGLKTVVFALGAHLAVDQEWTLRNKDGACSINGAPYHWRYELVQDGKTLQSGNRDRSIMCQATTGGNGMITVAKRCFVGATEVFTDPFGSPIPFEFVSPTIGPLIGTDEDNFFDVACGDNVTTAIEANKTHTVTESLIGQQGQGFGWELRNISCVGTNTNGGNVSTYAYTGAENGTAAFELGDRTAEIALKNGDNVTCTFFNHQAEMPLHKLINGESATCTNDPNPDNDVPDEGVRPCTFTDAGLTLTDSDPRFTFDLYFTGPDGQPTMPPPFQPFTFPSPALASAKIPPFFEAPGLIGVPLTLCEEPSAPYSLVSVTVEITDSNGNTITVSSLSPTPNLSAVYYRTVDAAVQGFTLLPFLPHLFPAGTYGCFNILLPSGTTKFEIFANNSVVCSITQGGWGAPNAVGNNPAKLLADNFGSVYANGLDVGSHETDGSLPWNMHFTSAAGVQEYLPAGGTAGPLNNDYTDPVSTNPPVDVNGSGVFGGQVTALHLNVDFSKAGVFPDDGPLGDVLFGGQTVSSILAAAETALSGGGGDIPSLNALVSSINQTFNVCTFEPATTQ